VSHRDRALSAGEGMSLAEDWILALLESSYSDCSIGVDALVEAN